MWLANIPKGPSAKFYVENGIIFPRTFSSFGFDVKLLIYFSPYHEGTENDWKLLKGYKTSSIL